MIQGSKIIMLFVSLPWVTLPSVIVHRQNKIPTKVAYAQPNISPDPNFLHGRACSGHEIFLCMDQTIVYTLLFQFSSENS